ncbi:alpha/beta hydrolase [Micromonospora polyrhachis]|uniref:Pimeloyl-ACP methyl ester carboxylesterase n=1 Tax=Micromonospora polyrhachis TaxID=1282883 RepID=A0A7W7SM73_9ACTN|nr:alpha/beta hydrolase [Micromonospora polyrhachis]MBB4957216.1 pimeloyl-ACP methyl ester carboxylesterase [Micromonospora polyrhachis]
MNKVTSADGTTVAAAHSGDGPAVVLVGGALQHRAIDPSTQQLVALLAPDFTVWHYERRGRGDSGDTLPYAVDREIEDLAAVIAAAGGSAAVYGMSSGAALALRAAASGLPITRLALYEPPLIVDESRPPLPADYLPRLAALPAAGRRGDAVALFMTDAVGVPAEEVAGMRQAPVWSAFEAVAHTLAYDGAVMGDTMSGQPLPTQWATSVTVPTLVIDGGASEGWARTSVAELAELLPAGQRRSLDGQTHAVDPAVLAPVLAEFLRG